MKQIASIEHLRGKPSHLMAVFFFCCGSADNWPCREDGFLMFSSFKWTDMLISGGISLRFSPVPSGDEFINMGCWLFVFPPVDRPGGYEFRPPAFVVSPRFFLDDVPMNFFRANHYGEAPAPALLVISDKWISPCHYCYM